MGLAYLPDGTSIDYKQYIEDHPHWQKVRQARLKFDNYSCVVCHKDCRVFFETHHLYYDHLGNEHLTDVITLCSNCHTRFHNAWTRQSFWKGREKGHWETYSIEDTAKMCFAYWREDRLINKNPEMPNLCNRDVCRQYVDRYFKDFEINRPIKIDPNDFALFVRNKRYELFFDAEQRGLSVEQFLDEYYGQKVRGENPIRVEAGKKNGSFDHEPKSFHRHYKENQNINRLMKEVRNLERKGENNNEEA